MPTRAFRPRADRPVRGLVLPGFTLIESVVAGSVVMFVLALLAPSLRATRGRDHLVSCLANMRAIGQASLLYASDDPNEIMIPVPNIDVLGGDHPGTIEWGGKAGRGQSYYPMEFALSIFGTVNWRGPAHRPLNSYLYPDTEFVDYNPITGNPNPGDGYINWLNDTNLDLGIYRCPADTGYAGGGFLYRGTGQNDSNEQAFRDEGLTAYDHYGTSYMANTFWVIGGIYGNQFRSQSVYLTPLSRVQSPSHTIAYQEVPARYAWLWGDWSGGACNSYSDFVEGNFNTIPGWHDMDFNFNVTFADGHAATVEIQGTIRPAPNLGSMNYPPYDCGCCSLYDCHRCVTLRGPEWALDTLPTPAVLTPFYADRSPAKSTGMRFVP